MTFVQVVGFVMLHALPKRLLRRWLCERLSPAPYLFEPFFSGRVSLFILARKLISGARSRVALVPECVCNIVPRAFTLAGWTVVTYPIYDDLEPRWDELLMLIDAHHAGVLVGASVFGSSGLLTFLGDSDKLASLQARSIQVVVDIAQDIRLADFLPGGAADWVHTIVSFNDKSFPGAMGGGIISAGSVDVEHRHRLTSIQLWTLYRHVAAMTLRSWRLFPSTASVLDGTATLGFEYSTCGSFPNRIEESAFDLAKLQYVMALLGVWSLPYYQKRKLALVQRGMHVPTRFASTAPYLATAPSQRAAVLAMAATRKMKRPYARENRPSEGVRAHDIIFHNKGFSDF
jgi:hypothetical protein